MVLLRQKVELYKREPLHIKNDSKLNYIIILLNIAVKQNMKSMITLVYIQIRLQFKVVCKGGKSGNVYKLIACIYKKNSLEPKLLQLAPSFLHGGLVFTLCTWLYWSGNVMTTLKKEAFD